MRVVNVLIQNGALIGAQDSSGNSPQDMWPSQDLSVLLSPLSLNSSAQLDYCVAGLE